MSSYVWPRGYDKHSVQATQRIEDFAVPRSEDPRFPRKRIRSFLKAHGYRGPVLETECDRVMAGPGLKLILAETAALRAGIRADFKIEYPYGWQKRQMPRLWRRMFHGGKTSLKTLFCLDEFHRL